MKYYQVLPQYDNYRLPKMFIYIENELFTEKEVEKYGVNKKYCKEVEIHTSKRGYNYYYCTTVHRNIRNSSMPDRDCPYANKVIRKSNKK